MSSKRSSSAWRRASPAETCASCTTPRTLYRTKRMGYLCVRRAPASTSSCHTLEASPEKMRSAIEAMTEHRALREHRAYIGSGTRPTTNIHEQRTSNPPRCASSPLQRVRPGRLPPNLYCYARYARPRVPRSLHLIRLLGGSVVLPLCHVVMRFLFLRQDTSVFLQRGGLCEAHRIRKR